MADISKIPQSTAIFTTNMRSMDMENFVSKMDSFKVMLLQKVGIWTLKEKNEISHRLWHSLN